MIVYLFNRLGAFRRTRGALIFALLLTATLDPCSGAAQRRSTRGGAQAQPRLVVLIVVDALGYDYLARHESVLGSGGFRRLLAGGASFADARYAYAGTRTAPGHASIATGALPAVHGVVANNWFDRATGKEVAFEDDAGERIVGRAAAADPPGVSPRNLIGSTIADELREATGGRARVVSLSVKTRAAVILGGHRPAGAYWFDEETGKAVTSSYYRTELPPWV